MTFFMKQAAGLLKSARSCGVLGLILALMVIGVELTVTALPVQMSLALFATPNLVSNKGCFVTARPYWSGSVVNYPYTLVTIFDVALSANFATVTLLTNANGVTNSVFVPWRTTIQAYLTNSPVVVSNQFTCGAGPNDQK